jgi:hypothetical protein
MMPIHFYLPDQRQAWDRLNLDLMSKRSGFSPKTIAQLFVSGQLALHAMATAEAEFGYLALLKVSVAEEPWLQVFWCETRPVRSLRHERDWLQQAADYLVRVAREAGCCEVKIAVAQDHPSRDWLDRLKAVGFEPRQVELGIRVKQENSQWVA